ncbi:hypothetical protein NKG05_30070 [Oerskovia sp. M15]
MGGERVHPLEPLATGTLTADGPGPAVELFRERALAARPVSACPTTSSTGSAPASTACLSRSSSPPHGSACCPCRRSSAGSTRGSPCSPRETAVPRNGTGRCTPSSTGAGTS